MGLSTALLLASLITACGTPSSPSPLSTSFTATTCTLDEQDAYAISGYLPQAVDALPYGRDESTATALDDPRYPVDADGIFQQAWEGHPDGVFHPVNTALYALYLLETHRGVDSPEHLQRAIANGEALLAGARSDDAGALWFPYAFDYQLRGDAEMSLEPPWYSGMAQGQALSLFTRLHQETADPRWQAAAEATFQSFLGEYRRGEPHFRLEADNGCLWFEEYVDDELEPTHVVNGHIYALFGLYDYAREWGDPVAIEFFDAGATTIRESFDSFRVPDELSRYCASDYCARTQWAPESYHRGVAAQLDHLAEMTGAADFSQMAHTLRADTSG